MKFVNSILFAFLFSAISLFAQSGDIRWVTTQVFEGRIEPNEKERSIAFLNHGCSGLDMYVYCSNHLEISLINPDGSKAGKYVTEPYIGDQYRSFICLPCDRDIKQPPGIGQWKLKLVRKNTSNAEHYSIAINFIDSRFDYRLKTNPPNSWAVVGDTVTLRLEVWELTNLERGVTRCVSGATVVASYTAPRGQLPGPGKPVPLEFTETTPGSGEYISTLKVERAGEWPISFNVSGKSPDGVKFSVTHSQVLNVINKPKG